MNAEKASTLALLREAIGNPIHVLETTEGEAELKVKAFLPELSEASLIPVVFLITSLSFLEAKPIQPDPNIASEYRDPDGWTPADLLANLRFEEGAVRMSLEIVR